MSSTGLVPEGPCISSTAIVTWLALGTAAAQQDCHAGVGMYVTLNAIFQLQSWKPWGHSLCDVANSHGSKNVRKRWNSEIQMTFSIFAF